MRLIDTLPSSSILQGLNQLLYASFVLLSECCGVLAFFPLIPANTFQVHKNKVEKTKNQDIYTQFIS